jgi:uncharacterized protein YkwD
MWLAMTLELRKLAPALIALIAAFLFALAMASASPAAAKGNGCGPAADANPASVANGAARDAVVCLLNKQRANAGLKPLHRNKRLQRAAQRHNERMVGTGCFDHECNGESDLGKRLESVGYLSGGLSRWAYGENIAWGGGDYGTARSIVNAWMNSPPHRANILSRDFRDIGIGFSSGTPNSGHADGAIYTTDFGLRVG